MSLMVDSSELVNLVMTVCLSNSDNLSRTTAEISPAFPPADRTPTLLPVERRRYIWLSGTLA